MSIGLWICSHELLEKVFLMMTWLGTNSMNIIRNHCLFFFPQVSWILPLVSESSSFRVLIIFAILGMGILLFTGSQVRFIIGWPLSWSLSYHYLWAPCRQDGLWVIGLVAWQVFQSYHRVPIVVIEDGQFRFHMPCLAFIWESMPSLIVSYYAVFDWYI